MSVSTVSYFLNQGPQRQVVGATAGIGSTAARAFLAGQNAGQYTQTPVDDIIVVGDNAFSAGTVGAPLTNTNFAGTIVIGSQAAASLNGIENMGTGTFGPSTIIGFNALTSSGVANGVTVIGSNAMKSWNGTLAGFQIFGNAVVIGENAAANLLPAGETLHQCVLIGYKVCSASTQQGEAFRDSVVIGNQACSGYVSQPGGPGCARNVVIGSIAGNGMDNAGGLTTGANDNVYIGYSASGITHERGSVLIGSGATSGTAGSTLGGHNVGIGGTALGGTGVLAGFTNNVVIGAGAFNGTNNNCVLIGCGCGLGNGGVGQIAQADNQFLLELGGNGFAGTRKALLYGLIASASPGGLIVGHSTPATNRDIPGFNILKILNGTVTGVAPVGGGFFYGSGGRLHWVDTGNNDWALTGTAAGQLASSVVGYTNNAAAAAGTLTNAPVAGNPTKWIPINDNGTIRNIPAW